MKWLAVVCFVALALGIVGVSAAALATQYLFQEPAATTWSRYLEPEIAWQRAKYHSAGWLFDLLQSFHDQPDPREALIVSISVERRVRNEVLRPGRSRRAPERTKK